MSNILKKVAGGVYDELYYQYANRSTWKERLEISRRSRKAIAEAEKKRKEKEAAKAKEEAEKKPEEQQEVKDEKSETTTAEKVQGEVVDGANQEVKQDEDKIPDKVVAYIKGRDNSDLFKEIMMERANITNEMVKFVSWYIGANGAPAGGYSSEDQEFINGLVVYLKEKYPDDVKVEIPYPDGKVMESMGDFDVSGNFVGYISYFFDSEDILKNIRKIRNQYTMVQSTFKREEKVVDTSTKTVEEVKETVEDTKVPEFHKIEPEKVVPFKISEPSVENTFTLKDGEQSPAEDDNGTPVVNLGEFTDDEKKKLDEISLEVNKLLGPTPIQYMRNITGLVDMYLLRPNGYTDVYSLDIAGLTNGGEKSRLAINTTIGPAYIPFDNPLVTKALQNKFYVCTEEEYKENIEKLVYPPMFYNLVDFSSLKTDLEDNTKFKNNLAKVLDKIMEVNGGIVPRMRLFWDGDAEFRLVSDDKVSNLYPGTIVKGFKAKYSHGTIKIKKGEVE